MRTLTYIVVFLIGLFVGSELLLVFPSFPAQIVGGMWFKTTHGTAESQNNFDDTGLIAQTRDEGLRLMAKAAVQRILNDPYSAKFESLRVVRTNLGDAVCGSVNAKNGFGAYIGATSFVYERLVDAAIIESKSTDSMNNSYAANEITKYCVGSSQVEKSNRNKD